jgi:hypothetical protein
MQTPLATDPITAPQSVPLPMRQVQPSGMDHHQGKRMTKKEALEAIKLLAALESWAFSQSNRIPDYLVDDIHRSIAVLEMIALNHVEEKP